MTTCPVCGERFEPQASQAMPFCGPRCREIDLARWVNEQYRVPVERLWDGDDLGEVMN